MKQGGRKLEVVAVKTGWWERGSFPAAATAAAAILTAQLFGSAAHAAGPDPEVLLRQYQCTVCHARAETLAGPSWIDIATRYKGNAKAIAILTGVVKKGEHGEALWPMPPLPQVPEADARAMIVHILAQRE
jgi:cytochrome c551/c552